MDVFRGKFACLEDAITELRRELLVAKDINLKAIDWGPDGTDPWSKPINGLPCFDSGSLRRRGGNWPGGIWDRRLTEAKAKPIWLVYAVSEYFDYMYKIYIILYSYLLYNIYLYYI